MIKLVPVTLILMALIAGCATNEGDGPATENSNPSASESVDASAADAGSAAASENASPGETAGVGEEAAEPVKSKTTYPIRPRNYGMTSDDLRIWNTPQFKQWFAQSYLAETEVEPAVTVVEREQLLQVLEFISADQMNEAAALLEQQKGPAVSAVFDFTLANIYFQQDRLAEAAVNYKVATEKFPKYLRAWRNIGLIKVREGDFANAIIPLTRVIELGGGDSVTYGLLGFAYTNIENDIAAETAFRHANLLDPRTNDWRMGLARSFFKQRRYADAVALTQNLINENPDRADLWTLQANAYVGLKQPMRAAENFELVSRMGKATPESLNLLGDIYLNEELFDLGVDAYIRAMTLEKDKKPERAIRASKILTARNALDETEKLISKIDELHASRLSEADRIALKRLEARIAVSRGRPDAEADKLEEIVALDPLDGEALILLGQHAARTASSTDDDGKRLELQAKAIYYYERASGIEAFEADAKVRHAQLLVAQGKYREALPLLRRAQTIKPRENIQEYLEQVERADKGR